MEQAVHQLVRVGAALEVNGDLKAGQVGLVADIRDLPDFPALDEVGNFIDDGLDGGRVWNFEHLNQVFLFEILPFGAHLERAAAGRINFAHFGLVENNLAAGRKIGCRQRGEEIVRRIFNALNGRAAKPHAD